MNNNTTVQGHQGPTALPSTRHGMLGGGEAEGKGQAMSSGEVGQLERGVVRGEVIVNGRVIWGVDTCSKPPKNKLKYIYILFSGLKLARSIVEHYIY